MSGSPTQTEIQAQWRATVDVLESIRNFADGTIAGAGGKLDVLLQALEGEYTPDGLSAFAAQVRSGLSGMVTSQVARSALTPVLYEYARYISTQGGNSGFRSLADVWESIYQWFVDNSLTVESRNIAFDTAGTAGVGNTGNGTWARLTVDENGFALEACTAEAKYFKVIADQNTGTEKHAEVWEVVGSASSQDALLRSTFGSGDSIRRVVTSRHAGSQQGGSLLQNSSFSEYNSTASPTKFAGWNETAGGAAVTQDTTNYYRTHPGNQTPASLKISAGSGTVTLKQAMTDMRGRRLDPDLPYFCRVMVNKTVGTAVGGSFTLRLGSQSVTVAVSSLPAGWSEVKIALGTGCWPRVFNTDPMDIEIEWSSPTSGFLLVDDAIFCPFDLIDGTYWVCRATNATPSPWLIDDTYVFEDTGGAPATAKIQWWCYVAGLGHLPSTTGVPTFTEP